ncbi:hypothetical protein AVEN_81109-1 [Araneus ventricosus]|uniref:Uncharacterized protein n=1 Tax=Araneus ventricosus TaxID=182803 RepID=A0A4Y2DWV7_ARAVE|nr:hypothetical protein AVEN_81109-1 [Araneus ventricosus]
MCFPAYFININLHSPLSRVDCLVPYTTETWTHWCQKRDSVCGGIRDLRRRWSDNADLLVLLAEMKKSVWKGTEEMKKVTEVMKKGQEEIRRGRKK